MCTIKDFFILTLLALRLLHGVEMHKLSEIVLKDPEFNHSWNADVKKSSLRTAHSKKKFRISSSVQERKIKPKTADPYKASGCAFTYICCIADCKSWAYFKPASSLNRALQNSLHLLYPF